MKKLPVAGMLLGAAALAGACYYGDEPAARPAPMVPAAAGVLSPPHAASILSEARCDREARCNRIGPMAQYSTIDHCLSVMRADVEQNLRGCGYGVKQRELYSCVAEIRNHACGGLVSPFDWFERMVTCQSSNLCLR
jgi:hypothetical protein